MFSRMKSELDDLERDLLQAADTWFDKRLHLKLQRLIAIARDGQRIGAALNLIASRDIANVDRVNRARMIDPVSAPVDCVIPDL
jgi:hypothetical protein